jgi:hypothetical protein
MACGSPTASTTMPAPRSSSGDRTLSRRLIDTNFFILVVMALPKRYRCLMRKTISKTIARSPRPPGQRNQPPRLEYPATKHPESPNVATHAANSVANFANRVNPGRTLCRFRTSTPPLSAQATLDYVLEFRNQRTDRVGDGLSCY